MEDVLKTDNLVLLLPIFPRIIQHLHNLKHKLSQEDRLLIGERLLTLVEDSIISELEYHCMWALELFTSSIEWGNEQKFFRLLGSARESTTQRQLILAMGRAKQEHWFYLQRNRLFEESPWSRRAFLAGASCMQSNVREHWYKSVEARLDTLEKAVMRWATANRF
ncbi:MAG: hypothetical protein DSM106950_10515 [Stigonema ocellatum SAG 48.90 = DSM 106950]|nr:hypothetical protein [Stigonema ocellatum SAG 48.90 = DSM 106950]